MIYSFKIPVKAVPYDMMLAVHSRIRYVTEGLTLVYVRDMYLDCGNPDGFERIKDSDACVGIGGGIYNDAVILFICCLNELYYLTLMV